MIVMMIMMIVDQNSIRVVFYLHYITEYGFFS